MTEKEIDEQLKRIYVQWLEEIKEIAPEFIDDDRYSNPYFACVPRGWCDSDVRILIVGKEGASEWGRGRSAGVKPNDIETIQKYGWRSLASYLNYDVDYDLYPIEGKETSAKKSPFWTRARKLSEYGVCAWTNQDTIHVLRSSNCALRKKERTRLHSTKTKLLAEEINALNPTHVVIMGWYHVSIRKELPKLYAALYPQDADAWYVNNEHEIAYRKIDGIHYICTYHPGWRRKPKGYEEEVLKVFVDILK